MRIMSFSLFWQKLFQDGLTTFRFPRWDQDWKINEDVQIYYKSRSRNRSYLGIARIVNVEKRWVIMPGDLIMIAGAIAENPEWDHVPIFSEAEAKEDGFEDVQETFKGERFSMSRKMESAKQAMWLFLNNHHGNRIYQEPMNKISLRFHSKVIDPDNLPLEILAKWKEANGEVIVH